MKILSLPALLLLAACSSLSTADSSALPEGNWQITEIAAQTAPPHAELRFLPQEKRLAATVGCNLINAGYQAEPPALRVGPAIATLMACPPETAAAEDALLQTLGRSDLNYRIEGEQLTLQQADGQVLLRARRAN